MLSELYKKDLYLNKDIPYLYGKEIYEYDIHAAGLSITKEFKLLSEKEIKKIENKPNKKAIAIAIGIAQRKDKVYKEELAKGFIKARKLFFEANNLEDYQILSIKKDAIFTLVPCNVQRFGEIEFLQKHKYSSCMMTDKYEFYYGRDEIDVKGLDDAVVYHHQDFLLSFMKKFFYTVECGTKQDGMRMLRVMIDRYKRLELDPGYYREFNRENNYKEKSGELVYSDVTPMLLPDIDISFNFINIILPLLKTLL